MIVAIQHPYEEGIQHELYQNVASVQWLKQGDSQIIDIYWIKIIFYKTSNEARNYKNGELYTEFDPKEDTFQIYKENK